MEGILISNLKLKRKIKLLIRKEIVVVVVVAVVVVAVVVIFHFFHAEHNMTIFLDRGSNPKLLDTSGLVLGY